MTDAATLAHLTGNAAIALIPALLYLSASKLAAIAAGWLRQFRWKKAPLPFESGRFVRQESGHLAAVVRGRANAGLLFAATLGSLLVLGRRDWVPALPAWAFWLFAVALAGFSAWALVDTVRLQLRRRRLDGLGDTHVLVADRLNVARARGYKVFHQVPMREGIVGHVVVSPRGAFAIQVISAPSSRYSRARLEGKALVFYAGDELRESRFTTPCLRPVRALREALVRTLGHDIKVTPVIVIGDCDVEAGDTRDCLLATPGNCVMFVGSSDPSAHLMDDDVHAISNWIVDRCRTNPFRKWRTRTRTDIGYST